MDNVGNYTSLNPPRLSFTPSLGLNSTEQHSFDGSSGSKSSLSLFYTKQELVIATIIEICLAVLGTFGNCLVCVAILKNRALHIASNFYMVSLAIADLLITAILVPMRAAQHLALFNGGVMQEAVVHVLGFIGRITILASISSLAALSNDRRVALKNPLKYHSVLRFAKGRAVKYILAIWAFATAFTSVPLIPGVADEVFLIGFVSFVLIVSIFILFTYGNIFYLVRQSTRWRISTRNLSYTKRSTPCNSLKEQLSRPKTVQRELQTLNSVYSIETELTCVEKTEQDGECKIQRNHSSGFPHVDAFSLVKEQNKTEAPPLNRSTEAVLSCVNKTELDKRRKRKPRSKIRASTASASTAGKDTHIERKVRRNSYSGRAYLNTIPTSSTYGRANLGRMNHARVDFQFSGRTACRKIATGRSHLNASQTQIKPRIGSSFASTNSIKPIIIKPHCLPGRRTAFDLPPIIRSKPDLERMKNLEINSPISSKLPLVKIASSASVLHASQTQVEHRKTMGLAFKLRSVPEINLKNISEVDKSCQEQNASTNIQMCPKKQPLCPSYSKRNNKSPDLLRDQEARLCSKDSETAPENRPALNWSRSNGAQSRPKGLQLEFKIAKTTAFIVMLFILLVYPRIIVIIYSLSAGNKAGYVMHARLWMRILLYCNSVVNPFLYSLRHRKIWWEFMKLARCCSGKRQHARA